METKQAEAATTTATTPEMLHKDSNFLLKSKVLSILNSGEQVTAKELNIRLHFNDATKVFISCLRCDGMDILDVRLQNRCKMYWYVVNSNQLSLFEKGGYSD